MVSTILANSLRTTARRVSLNSSRNLSSSAVVSKDFVQELYLKELKAYKVPPTAKDAHVGHVKNLHIPSGPQAPEVLTTATLSTALEEYDSTSPSTVSTASASPEPAQPYKSEADEFLEEYQQPYKEEHGAH